MTVPIRIDGLMTGTAPRSGRRKTGSHPETGKPGKEKDEEGLGKKPEGKRRGLPYGPFFESDKEKEAYG
jgi:hypothetical protein